MIIVKKNISVYDEINRSIVKRKIKKAVSKYNNKDYKQYEENI